MSNRILSTQEIAVASRMGVDIEAIAEQKSNPIFGLSLHGAAGPHSRPLRPPAPDRPVDLRSSPSLDTYPVDELLDADGDDDDQAKDPLNLRGRKRAGVVFPGGKRI
jgi:hypothetical protein